MEEFIIMPNKSFSITNSHVYGLCFDALFLRLYNKTNENCLKSYSIFLKNDFYYGRSQYVDSLGRVKSKRVPLVYFSTATNLLDLTDYFFDEFKIVHVVILKKDFDKCCIFLNVNTFLEFFSQFNLFENHQSVEFSYEDVCISWKNIADEFKFYFYIVFYGLKKMSLNNFNRIWNKIMLNSMHFKHPNVPTFFEFKVYFKNLILQYIENKKTN